MSDFSVLSSVIKPNLRFYSTNRAIQCSHDESIKQHCGRYITNIRRFKKNVLCEIEKLNEQLET